MPDLPPELTKTETAIVLDCIDAKVRLSADEGKLRVRKAKGTTIDPALVERIRSSSDALTAFLQHDLIVDQQLALGPIRHDDNLAAMSSGQERLWFMFQLEEDPLTYNMFGSYRITGDFNYAALDAALQAIMFRHQVFRTFFESYDGAVVQKVYPVSRVHIPVDDLTEGRSPDELEQATIDWIQAEAETAFDLSQYPLWRFRLASVGDDAHVFTFSVHHILCDGLSELILLDELGYWYQAFLDDPTTDVPELPVRYCDYSAWQKRYLGSMRYLQDLAYWRRTLTGAPRLIEVPTDRPRPPVATNNGAWVSFDIPASSVEQLWQVGRDAGTTTYVVGLTLFTLMLSTYTGQDDLVVGTPVSNRNHPDLQALVGFFVNSVPIRCRLEQSLSFRDLVAAVSRSAFEAFDHQNVPLENLVDQLDVPRDPSFNPLFQVMFAMEDDPYSDEEEDAEVYFADGALQMQPLDIDVDSTMFDLDLLLIGKADGSLKGGFNYNTDLYEPSTIRGMCDCLMHFAETIANNPDVTLAELRSSTKTDELLRLGTGPVVNYDLDTTMHDVIDAQIKSTPNAVAVEHGDTAYTYTDLDRAATAIAERLTANGVEPGHMVALELPRSFSFVAAILAVLRCGAAYVPIDPDYPDDRRSYMRSDSQARLILRRGPTKDDHQDDGSDEIDLIELAGVAVSIVDGSANAPLVTGGTSPIAYMIYTSGSTGRPKGAMVRHDGALNHVYAEVDALGLREHFDFLQTAPSSSDISVWQLLGPLMLGGRTIIVDTATQLDIPVFFDLIQTSRASVVELVPAIIQLLCEHSEMQAAADRSLAHLRHMIITGEAAPVPVVNRWLELYPGIPVVNAYGPTEAADDVIQDIITEPLDAEARSVPVGLPIANMNTYLVDAELRLVPRGVVGEICLSGVGVGAGYFAKPERTAQAFVDNPYATERSHAVLYRTGDLGRWRTDGRLECLGRVDDQIKIRGFRVELGEISACVASHEAVREAAATLATGPTGDAILVAYYSTIGDSDLTPDELRSHLVELLPVQIVPNVCVCLVALPHLPNGKVDVDRLPKPELASSAIEVDDTFSPTETTVHGLWCDLLGINSLPKNADFFAWGGHSLLAVRMLAAVEEMFDKQVSIAGFFAEPAFDAFCELLDRTEVREDQIVLAAHHQDRYPLSPGQARLWFLSLFESDNSSYNMPGALKLDGELDVDVLGQSLTKLIDRHSSLRTRIGVENGAPFQEILPPFDYRFAVEDLDVSSDQDVEAKIAHEATQMFGDEFDLSEAPLWRFRLFRVSPTQHYLLNTAHHIITDGLSNEILIHELVTIYTLLLADADPDDFLEPIAFQYGDYAEWQLALLRTSAHRRQQLYWERKLNGAPALSSLPTDRPRPAVQTYNGDAHSFELAPELVVRLRDLAIEQRVTMFMVFQAASAILLHMYSGEPDIVVGTPIGGRRLRSLEPIVGFFVNTIVLRTQIDTDATIANVIAAVKQTAIEAFEHSDVPFEQIVERVATERHPAFSPVFQVMVAYEHDDDDDDEADELPGIEVDVVAFNERSAMFDLDILFSDEGAEEISCDIAFNCDLFDSSTIEQLGRHLEAVLEHLVLDSAQLVSDIVVTTPADEDHLRQLEQGPAGEWPLDLTLDAAFDAQALARPDAIAVIDGETTLTYAELHDRAELLANRLAEAGVHSGDRVAIMDARSDRFLTAILATLKVGATYVPVDPSYPTDRVRYMLEDCASGVVLSGKEAEGEALAAVDGLASAVLLIDPTETDTMPAVPRRDISDHGPGAAAYMIYTSGSTGKPKGALVTHAGQYNHVRAEAELLDLDQSTVFLQTAPSSSDISVWQFLGPVLLGGTTVIVDTETLLITSQFIETVETTGATLFELVPALFDHLLDHIDACDDPEAEKQRLASVQHAIITGEAALPATINRWLSAFPHVPLINAYGPTEAADDVCQLAITEPIDPAIEVVSIGRPVANMSVLVLDDQLRRRPLGVRGEICLAGVGVGLGYWRRDALTSEVFVDNPHRTGDNDAVLYRTGDIGRWNNAGQLEFLGRRDTQVKLLGMRLELGEIDSALQSIDGVKEAAVIVTDNGPQRLVAFWSTSDDQATMGDDELSISLRELLPQHMVPSTFIQLPRLPRTPVGKIDRGRLPVGLAEAAFSTSEYVAPSSDDETTMVEIWSVVLDVERVSMNADFFELGGNSLLAVALVSQMANAFEVEVSLVDFFGSSTVEGTLALIASLKNTAEREEAELSSVDIS